MKFNRWSLAGALLAAVAFAALPASAQEKKEGGEKGMKMPVSFTERPLTLPAMTLSPYAEIEVLGGKVASFDLETEFATSLNAKFGILDDLEVGARLVPLRWTPSPIKYGDPTVFVTYRFLRNELEAGAYVEGRIPTRGGEDRFGLTAGLTALLHIEKIARLDAGAFFTLNSTKGLGGLVESLATAGNIAGLAVPVRFAYDIIEPLHVGVNTGLFITDLGQPKDTMVVPLGVFAGYAIAGEKGPILDLDPFFQFPVFVLPGAPTGTNKLQPGVFQVGLEVAGYLYL